MVELLRQGYDMLIGERLSSTFFQQNKRRFHNNGNLIVKFMVNFLFKYKIGCYEIKDNTIIV